jgi:phosphoribosylanthranilate isomerase
MIKTKSISLKICGMRDPKNILEVAALQIEYMGFIFYKKSPRYVGEDFSIPADFPATTKRVGVFVNEEVEIIKSKAVEHKLDFIQLHGAESVTDCSHLKRAGLRVIKVFSVDDQFDFNKTIPYETVVDYFLFDTKGKFYGGNAATFDWNILITYNQRIPFFLSGGLNQENISEIRNLKSMNLHAVDVNSGVETSPALKNIDKIKSIQQFLTSDF